MNAHLKRYDFNPFLKQARVRAERTSPGKSFQAMGAKLWPKCFCLLMYRLTELKKLQQHFVSYTISFTMSRQKRTKLTGVTIVKKLVNYSGSFEDASKGISHQDSSLISQALSYPPEITNLNET